MNLAQLKFVRAVASRGSFTAAAAECCVTQPTLSNGIAQLEHELGSPLFARTTRKVELTPFGAHIMPYIDQVLGGLRALESQTKAYLKPSLQFIRIGASPLLNSSLLMLEPFRTKHPEV